MNVHGLIISMMILVMSILSVKFAKKLNFILGGQTVDKHVQKMLGGVSTIMLARQIGKIGPPMLGSIATSGIAITPLSS